MLTMQAAPPLQVSDDERAVLERLATSSSAPHRAVIQARALLLAADGVANYEIARRCGVSANTVRDWRKRFASSGVEDIGKVQKGRGRRSWLPDGTVAAVMKATLEESPSDGSTHWSTRTMAARFGIGKDTVQRIWANHEVKPWKVATFKLSHDPRFEEKLVDVVGLYLNPPKRAVVFSFDEKTQVQALDRTQPSLPLRPGRAGTMTHDYKRNGTTDLFAALNVRTGEVLTECRGRHTGNDVLAFFKKIDRAVPRRLEIHVVLDNLSAHQTPDIGTWLADPKRARWHLHFTPTSSSWLNLVERFFAELTNRRLRRGVFTSVPVLIEAIDSWIAKWNEDPKPFVWHKAADEIVEKVRRGRAALAQVNSDH
jgi:transposase/transposase-like protein